MATASFVPVHVLQDFPAAEPAENGVVEGSRSVEIVRPDGTILRVAEEIGLTALRRVLSGLRG
ncbi:hypothetical protein [Roseomonas sp. WA12]